MGPQIALAIFMMMASAAMQQEAADAANDKATGARLAEQDRQDRIQKERDAALTEALARNNPQDQQKIQLEQETKLSNAFTPQALKENDGQYVASAGAPTEIADRMSQQLAKSLKSSQDYAGNLAKVKSYGNLTFENALANKRTAESTNLMNRNSQNSLGLLNGELNAASKAGQGYAQGADIAGSLGQAAYNSWLTSGNTVPNNTYAAGEYYPAMQQASSWYSYQP